MKEIKKINLIFLGTCIGNQVNEISHHNTYTFCLPGIHNWWWLIRIYKNSCENLEYVLKKQWENVLAKEKQSIEELKPVAYYYYFQKVNKKYFIKLFHWEQILKYIDSYSWQSLFNKIWNSKIACSSDIRAWR